MRGENGPVCGKTDRHRLLLKGCRPVYVPMNWMEQQGMKTKSLLGNFHIDYRKCENFSIWEQ